MILRKIYCKVNSYTTSRLSTWRRQANEIAMRRHFATSTGRRIQECLKVTETGVQLNATMHGASRIHDKRLPYNKHTVFYKYRRCTNFVQVSQTQTTTLTRYVFVSNSVLLLDNP